MYIIVAMMILADDQTASREIDPKEAIQIAENAHEYLVDKIRDYTGILVKREFVNGKDTGHHYIKFKFREEPLGIYLIYLKPNVYKGREVLYNGGNELLVRRGGGYISNLTLTLKIDSPLALDNNRYTVQEMGLRKLAEKLLTQIKTEMNIPDTKVEVFDNVKIDSRPITHYRLTHQTQTPKTECRTAEISIDQKLHIPIYYRAIGWNKRVLEEYFFRDVVLNPGLTDADFSDKNPSYGFQQHKEEARQ